jgi:hypothetical protein
MIVHVFKALPSSESSFDSPGLFLVMCECGYSNQGYLPTKLISISDSDHSR